MRSERVLVDQIADLVRYSVWGNPWHSFEGAADGLLDEDVEFSPLPGLVNDWGDPRGEPQVLKPSAMLRHVLHVVVSDGARRMADPTGDPVEGEWNAISEDGMTTAADFRTGLDAAFRLGLCRLNALADEDLLKPDTAEPRIFEGADLMSMAIQMLVIHQSWHFGQLAKLIDWRKQLSEADTRLPEAKVTSAIPAQDEGGWAFPKVSTRQELLVELVRTAQSTCPWHSMDRVLRGATEEELAWQPFAPHAELPGPTARHLAHHVAACDIIYSDMAFGEQRDDWEWAASLIGPTDRPWTAEDCIEGTRRGAEFLMDHLAKATDEQLDATYPMHHGVPHTGWQVAGCMVQHRLWHAGQICMMRECHAALGHQ